MIIFPWTERARLCDVASTQLVVVGDPSRLLVLDADRLGDALDVNAIGSRDGSVLLGRAGDLAALLDGVTGEQAEVVLALWRAGSDLYLDLEGELCADASSVRIAGEVALTNRGSPAVVFGDVAVLAERIECNRGNVDALLRRDRLVLGDPEVVANDIVAVRLWNATFCAALVDAVESFDAWGSDPDDPVPGMEWSLFLAPRLFDAVERDVAAAIVPRLRSVWPEFAWCGLADAFVIRYDAVDGQSELRLHHDVAQISAAVKLNSGYSGGALEFPRQRWDNASCLIGELVAWPSLVTHPHRSAVMRDGRKYGLTLWFAVPA